MTETKLKLVDDAPSMLVVLDAVTQAQAILAGYIQPSNTPRDAEAIVVKLLTVLDDRKVRRAVDTLLPDE